MRRRRPASARAGLLLVLLLTAAVLTLPVYQCLVQVESSEQAQGRQVARAWRFRRGCSQLGRSAGPPRFVAPLGLGSEVEGEVCRRNWMQ
jgi:hypothetical protein